MPLYEYLCESCGRRSEILQKIGEPPATDCPHCGGALKKLLSAPAFQFKGSGWYVTDYARGGAEKGGRSGSAGEGDAAKPGAAEGGASSAPKQDAETKKADAGGSTPPAAKPKAD
jgi:putative FmdB family regulatory protein